MLVVSCALSVLAATLCCVVVPSECVSEVDIRVVGSRRYVPIPRRGTTYGEHCGHRISHFSVTGHLTPLPLLVMHILSPQQQQHQKDLVEVELQTTGRMTHIWPVSSNNNSSSSTSTSSACTTIVQQRPCPLLCQGPTAAAPRVPLL